MRSAEQIHLPCEECNGKGWRMRLPDNVRQLEPAAPTQPTLPATPVHGYMDAATGIFHPYSESAQ